MALHVGSKGPAVTDVQAALKKRGFNIGDASGVFGHSTERAVKAFQGQHGLAADGIVRQPTWAALGLRGQVPVIIDD